MRSIITTALTEENNENIEPVKGAGRLPRSDTARTAYETNEIRD